MNRLFRTVSIFAALALLVAVFGIGPALAKQMDRGSLGQPVASQAPQQVTLAEDQVAWTDAAGNAVDWIMAGTAGTNANFYIRDRAASPRLESTKSATATWTNLTANQPAGTVFNLGTGDPEPGAYNLTSDADNPYNQGAPATTPLTAPPTVTVGGTTFSGVGANQTNGTFTLPQQVNAGSTVTATFSYHIQDVYDTAARRAKAFSTSDPAGEYVQIQEVAGVGNTAAAANSDVYQGVVLLINDPAVAGTNNDGVWVQDGDVVTVQYLDEDGNVISSDTIKVDDTAPTISNIIPADGTITNVANPTVQFDVTDLDSGIDAATVAANVTLSINGNAVNPTFLAIENGFRGIFTTAQSWLTQFGVVDSTPFNIEITAKDVAGNQTTLTGADAISVTIDRTKPQVQNATTGVAWDAAKEQEKTNVKTAVRVVFSEPLDPKSIDPGDFTVGGVTPSAAVLGTDTTGAGGPDFTTNVYLTVDPLASDARPQVAVVGSITDLAGNELDVTSDAASKATAADGLGPALTASVSTALAVEDDEVTITVTTDEKPTGGVTVSIVGPPGAAINGTKTVTATDPLTREASVTIGTSNADPTGAYGVAIKVSDGANISNNLTSTTDEQVAAPASKDVVGTNYRFTLTLANGPIADADFDGDVDAADLAKLEENGVDLLTLGGATITINASARTITVTRPKDLDGDGADDDPTQSTFVASYSVPDHSFIVDQSAPAFIGGQITVGRVAVVAGAEGVEVAERSPFISIVFDEAEVPGDPFKTVSVTSAELTLPDGTTMDITADLVTKDNITWVYPAQNLALGDYSLSVTAVDDAGNEVTQSFDFKITEPPKFQVDLQPGWNLISLPAEPVNGDINTVIPPSVPVTRVFGYNPNSPTGWDVAFREAQEDGTLGPWQGTLKTIDAKRGYFVFTSSFDPIEVELTRFTPGAEAGGVPATPPTLTLLPGWNLVPVLDPTGLLASGDTIDANDYFGGLLADITRIYGLTPQGQLNRIVPTTAEPDASDDLAVGQAYWVYTETGGVLVP